MNDCAFFCIICNFQQNCFVMHAAIEFELELELKRTGVLINRCTKIHSTQHENEIP